VTGTVMLLKLEPPFTTLVLVHVTVWLDVPHVQFVPIGRPACRPVGDVSATVTVVPSVARPPVWPTASVKLPVARSTKVAALDVFVIVKLIVATVLTVTVAVSDVVSPPPTALAVCVGEAEAFEATVTGTVMLLKLEPPFTTLVLVHVTVWLDVPHVQFVPVAVPGVNPVGNVSATVTVVPSVATPPVFATASVKLPVDPRTKVAALDVFVIVKFTGSTVLTVTERISHV